MEQNSSQSIGLETQLRNMILGNVSITGHTSQEAQFANRGRGRGRARGRGRGRGRGSFSGGTDGNHQDHSAPSQGQIQNQGHHANTSINAHPPRGGGRGYYPNPRHQQVSTNFYNAPRNGLNPDNQPHGSRPSRPHQQWSSNADGTPRAHPPRVLQRPLGDARLVNSYVPYPQTNQPQENPQAQIRHLDMIATEEIPKVEMSRSELESKEEFRRQLETIMREALARDYSGDMATISLVGFGSLASGFGLPGSDMDLAVIPEWKDSTTANDTAIDRGIPRLLERAVLDAKLGGRLLTRTRVPILKICQYPTETLYAALTEERSKWDKLPEEEKYPSDEPQKLLPRSKFFKDSDDELMLAARKLLGPSDDETMLAARKQFKDSDDELIYAAHLAKTSDPDWKTNWSDLVARADSLHEARTKTESSELTSLQTATKSDEAVSDGTDQRAKKDQQHRPEKSWSREKIIGPLDFPKTGCGIQCDINFANPLGIQNTHMLRCYSLTDPRVRPMVLFVKSWAKRRKVNSAYSGTLSSYGWVLMVLHYLVNIATPPVCPNLQLSAPLPADAAVLEQYFKHSTIAGYVVRFWRDEQEIVQAAQQGRLTQNMQSLGALLRGFFQYYASLSGYGYPRPPQFHWTNEVLSLRTPGGIVSKQSKGWVSATTKITAEKKVTNRYLFAIEDPFETDHNVARTVTHRGIVAIRDEFRRAWRILRAIGTDKEPEGGIFDEIVEEVPPPEPKVEEAPKGTVEA